MSDITVSKKNLVCPGPPADAVTVERDVQFRAADGGTLTFDLYRPRERATRRLPAVIIAAGYPDAGYAKHVGCRFKEMQSVQSWAVLIAASGLAAIAYENRDPAADFLAVLGAAQGHPDIDGNRLGVWANSGNVPVALSALMRTAPVRVQCAVLLYGYMLDLDGSTAVADAAAAFRFANPCAGRTMADLDRDASMFIVRCGRDETPRIRESIDAFARHAMSQNLPFTIVNHADAPHAFDLFDDSERSRDVIGQALRFLQSRS